MASMKGKKIVVGLLGVTAALVNVISGSAATAGSFDKPVRKTVVDLGPSSTVMPKYPARIQLSCFYYHGLMVKQWNDQGVKGAPWVTITPAINGSTPACRPTHGSTEQFMTKDGWFFEGVKGPLLFLEASEGDENAGMPFRVLDIKTGKKVFEDSARAGAHLEFARTSNGNMSLRYLRRVGGDCSIPKDGMSCWNKFSNHYRLAVSPVPQCTGYRREGEKEWVVGAEGVPPEEINTPSAIDYPVVVEFFPEPSIRAVPGPVSCFAE